MTVIASLCSHLINNAGVAAEVSDDVFQDLGPPESPDKYIIVTLFDGASEHDQAGVSGKVRDEFQVNCFARSAALAALIGEKVRLAIDGLIHGTLGTSPDDMTVTSVFIGNKRSATYPTRSGGPTEVHGFLLPVTIWSVETDPGV